jgi:sugar lactone lactonase YvrE
MRHLWFVACCLYAVGMSQDSRSAAGRAGAALELVATFDGPMPTGVTVSSDGRVFVNFPRWGDAVDFTVAEVRDGSAVAFPNAEMNKLDPGNAATTLLSVQSVVVDASDRLWALDTANPNFAGVIPGGAKLVAFDLGRNIVAKTIRFDADVVPKTTYLNDVRFDLRRGAEGIAYVTDSAVDGPNAIIVVDLATGRSLRRLHDHPSTKAERGFLPIVRGEALLNREPGKPPTPLTIGSDGIAISNDGSQLFYCPLASRRLFAVPTDVLADPTKREVDVARAVIDLGEKGAADGLESDADGNLYATNFEHHAILRRKPGASWEVLVQDEQLEWPDTLSVAADGYLYVMTNQLHLQARFHEGRDLRKKPYRLLRLKVGSQPVRLKKS